MDYVKRKPTSYRSLEKNPKKLRSEFNQSITCIENLSNELIYEIFDYLGGCEIYESFVNLNHRFEQLLNSLLYKIKCRCYLSEETFLKNSEEMILFHRQQIFSIHLWPWESLEHFFTLFHIDSSFHRLESLVIDNFDLEPEQLISFLINLASLPRLFSLTFNWFITSENLNEIYQLIFALPSLKYTKISVSRNYQSISFPVSISKQQNTIEHLVIDHPCTFNELFAILSNTPQLRRLKCFHNEKYDPSIRTISPIRLLNLTYISIHMDYVTFNQLKIFLTNLESKLKVLCVNTQSEDITFLYAYRWKGLIQRYFPHLQKFYLKFHQSNYNNEMEKPNQFFSSFWIERRWLFEVEINSQQNIYSIQPYRKRWYEYNLQNTMINSSFQLSRSNRLILTKISCDKLQKLIPTHINFALTIAQIYHLEILEEKIFIGLLIQLIDFLPLLNSIKIHSLSYQPRNLTEKEIDILCSTESTSRITKVYLEKMIDIREIYFLMQLCPYMAYLKVGSLNNMDVQEFIQQILSGVKYARNDYLCYLCVYIPSADDQLVEELKKVIDDEQLLIDYTIGRVSDDIHLQWKSFC